MKVKPITEAEFIQFKQMQDAGVTITGASKRGKRSWDAVRKMFNANSYAEFRNPTASEPDADAEPAIITMLRNEQRLINAQFETIIATLKKIRS